MGDRHLWHLSYHYPKDLRTVLVIEASEAEARQRATYLAPDVNKDWEDIIKTKCRRICRLESTRTPRIIYP